jgi:hypothetical protein
MPKVSISRAWDETKHVVAKDGRLLLPVALAMFVLPGIILDLAMPDAGPGKLPPPGLWMLVACAAILVSLIGQLAVIRLAMGPHVTVGNAIAHGARRLIVYVAAVVMWILPFILVASVLFTAVGANPTNPPPAAALGLFVVVIAMTYFAVRLMLTSPLASAEAIGPVAILARSWKLTHGNWWRLFGFFVMFMIGAIVLFWATEAVFGLIANVLLAGTDPGGVGWLVVRLVSQVVSALISVIFFVMLARIYDQLGGQAEAQAGVPSSGI